MDSPHNPGYRDDPRSSIGRPANALPTIRRCAGCSIVEHVAMPASKAPCEPLPALLSKRGRHELIQTCVIGRAEDNDVVIADAQISRRHALLFGQGDDWWVNDLGSRNGVQVNGVRLHHARRLCDGDELKIGGHRMTFVWPMAKGRTRLSQLGKTTQALPHAEPGDTRGAVTCELIVVTAAGEILEGDKAARWFFGKKLERPMGSAHAYLPPAVRQWLERATAASATGVGPLELCEADRRVVVTLGRSNEGRYFLLVREESANHAAASLKALGLSPREAEVMHWVCEGKTNPEIGQILEVTTHTVNRHLEHILAKLGVDNRQKAIITVMERLQSR